MTEALDARDAIAALQGHEAWAIIRRSTRAGDRETVGLVGGTRREVASILDIPLETGVPERGHIADRLVAIPFRQVRERGFEAHDDGTPLVVVDVASEQEFSVAEVLDAIDDLGVEFTDRGGFDIDDEAYAALVKTVIDDEIGQGEGANLVISRHYRAQVADWSAATALTVFRRLLEREHGAYWTFVFFTGDRYLIGASPERHVSVHGDDVRMNPISGTFRLGAPDGGGSLKGRFLDFLADEKEIYELFMVVDEELKMMCDICDKGGQVLGPFLKPMSRLVHTEYFLAGRTSRDPREVLRDTMYAATVTGSPVQNACRLIQQYETEGRGYYGAALAIFGRDDDGAPVVDSPIVIRTADVDLDGRLTVTAGATLVRDSDPAYEVAETQSQGRGHPRRLRSRRARAGADGQRRRAGQRRGRAARPQRPQPTARVVLADRPVRDDDRPRPGREARRDPRWRGRLREHAPTCPRRGRDDEQRRPARVVRRRRVRRGQGARRGRSRDRGARPRATPATAATRRSPPSAPRSSGSWTGSSRSSRCAWVTRCCATGWGFPWPTRTSSSRAPRPRSASTAGRNASGSTTPSSAGSPTAPYCRTA